MPNQGPNNKGPTLNSSTLSPPSELNIKRRFSFGSKSKPEISSGSASGSVQGETESNSTDDVGTKKKAGFLVTAIQNMKKVSSSSLSDGKAVGSVAEERVQVDNQVASPSSKTVELPGSTHTVFKTSSPAPASKPQLSLSPKPRLNKTLPAAPPSGTSTSSSKAVTRDHGALTIYPSAPLPVTSTTPVDTYAARTTGLSDFAQTMEAARKTVDRLQKVNLALTGLAAVLKVGGGWLPLVGTGVNTIVTMLNSAMAVEVGKVAALRLVEHSATVLAEIQQSIIDHNGDFSPTMQSHLIRLMGNLHNSMLLLTKLAERPFLKLYLFTADINAQVASAEQELQQCAMLFQLQSLISIDAWQQQAARDRAADMDMLFQMMRQAMETSEAMLRLINVRSNEQAEAIKTLQRSMETMIALQEAHNRSHEPSRSGSPERIYSYERQHPTAPVAYSTTTRRWSVDSPASYSGFDSNTLGLEGTPVGGESGRRQLLLALRDESPGRDFVEHKGFCEKALDVLRRHSSDAEVPDWTITSLEITHDEKVSSGFFAEIWRGTWKGHSVALKQLNANTDRDIFLKEINTWRSLRSPYILPLLGASSATGPPPWIMVSPYMSHGNILNYLERNEGKMANKVALGMRYLHSRELIHGDFKGTNVLINDEGRAIICDFGLSQLKAEIVARSLSGAQADVWTSNGGAMRWKSPERLLGAAFSYPADVYAFGITIFEVFNLTIPFGHVDDLAVRKNIIAGARPERPRGISDTLWKLEERCWSQDPVIRPSFEEIEAEISSMDISVENVRKGSIATYLTDSSEDSFHTAQDDRIPPEQQAISPTLEDHLALPDVGETSSQSSGSIQSIPPHLNEEPTNESDIIERIFRHHLEQHYDDRLRLPLWFPTPVSLGSVGYIRHGQFVKLLDAHQPPLGRVGSIADVLEGHHKSGTLPPRPFMSEFESLQIQTESVEVRGAAQTALDKAAVAWTKFIKGSGQTTEHAISYRRLFAFKPGSTRSAFLVVENGVSEIYKDNSAAREYLSENMDWILETYSEEHHIRKEDVIIVVGTLSAHNYAMLVSNFAPRVTVNFNVHADKSQNEPWGTWTIDQKPSPDELRSYKHRAKSENDQPRFCCKVSKVSASPMNAVLLARLKWSTVKQGYDMWD